MAWILVTGAARGLGRAIALELAKKKYSLVIHYNTSHAEALETVALCQQRGAEARLLQGDFSEEKSVKAFIAKYVEQFPQTEGLVNNVGNYQIDSLENTDPKQWSALFQTNVHAPFYLIHALLPSLKKQKGHILNIGTSGLNRGADLKSPAYKTTKMALLQLTLSLAKELAPEFVRVNMLSPGYLENSVDLPPSTTLPMKRPATLEEAAKIAAFLFDQQSDYITGQNIEVAGGFGL